MLTHPLHNDWLSKVESLRPAYGDFMTSRLQDPGSSFEQLVQKTGQLQSSFSEHLYQHIDAGLADHKAQLMYATPSHMDKAGVQAMQDKYLENAVTCNEQLDLYMRDVHLKIHKVLSYGASLRGDVRTVGAYLKCKNGKGFYDFASNYPQERFAVFYNDWCRDGVRGIYGTLLEADLLAPRPPLPILSETGVTDPVASGVW